MLLTMLLLGLLPAALMIDFGDDNHDDADDAEPETAGGTGAVVIPHAAGGTGAISAPHAAGETHDDQEGGAIHVEAPDHTHRGDVAQSDTPHAAGAAATDAETDGAEADGAEPTTLEIPLASGDVTVSDFRPGVDRIDLHLPSNEADFHCSTDENGDCSLHIDNDDGSQTVTFAGLHDLPVTDIGVVTTDPSTGTVSRFSLATAAFADAPMDDAGIDPSSTDSPVTEDATDQPLDPVQTQDEPQVGADPGLDPIVSVWDRLGADRGDTALNHLLRRDSDSFGSGDAADPGAFQAGSDGADSIDAAGDGGGGITWDTGTPILHGHPGVVNAGAGDDIVQAHGGAYVFGGSGDDAIRDDGAGSALFGGAGDDSLVAGPGGSVLDGGAGDDRLTGGDGDDVLRGGMHRGDAGSDDDVIEGNGGNDVIEGGQGADLLYGGDGEDVIDHMGRAEQHVTVEEHRFDWHQDHAEDHLFGGNGNDTLIFGDGDHATGGDGADQFHLYSGETAAATIADFHPGSDFLRITLDPALHHAVPELQVHPSADGQDGLVRVGGVTVAVLAGAPQATTEDVFVEVVQNIAA